MTQRPFWQLRLATLFWLALVVAAFCGGRVFDKTWNALFRQPPPPAADTDEQVFSFHLGLAR